MKKSSWLLVLFLGLMFSCQNTKKSEQVEVSENANEEIDEIEAIAPVEEIIIDKKEQSHGDTKYYTGMFKAKEYKEDSDYTWQNKITIAIDKIVTDSIYGRSIVAGNYRPFVGIIWEKSDGTKGVIAREPGDDKYDGVFTFSILNDLVIEGEWESYDENLLVTKRKYKLEEKAFVYDAENNLNELYEFVDLGKYKEIVQEYDGEKYYDQGIATVTNDAYEYNASTTLLKEKEVANMKKGDLQLIRNSIYARHGYSFKNKIYRTIFDNGGLEWYMPVSVDVSKELTELEKQNIALIKRYEDYAEDFYDTFGR